MLDIILHDLRAGFVAALLGEKGRAAVHAAVFRGDRMQKTLGVRGHGALRVADERRGGGVSLKAAAAAAGAFLAVFRDDHVPKLARGAGVTREELAAEHHAAAHARAERDDDGALRAFAAAEERFAQRRGVCVVAEVNGERRIRAQRASEVKIDEIQVCRKADDAACVVHCAGAADAHAADGGLTVRELRDDLTDARRDGLRAEVDAGRYGAFLQNVALCAHKRPLDVRAAEVNADIVHKSPSRVKSCPHCMPRQGKKQERERGKVFLKSGSVKLFCVFFV